MKANSIFDIPNIIASEKDALPFIEKRLEEEAFEQVKALRLPEAKKNFKEILYSLYTSSITFEQACHRTEQEIVTPPDYRKIRRWGERLVRTEMSKIFTLGYGDYLLSIGERECFIPHTKLDESEECLRVIAGRRFSIELIQMNIYKNYGLRPPIHPTVPLHANCRHIITKIE
jgi:hypothetical protein